MRTLFLLSVLLLTGASVEQSSTVTLRHFTVERVGNAFDISWEAEREADVHRYELYRKTSFAADFVRITFRNPKGAGKPYQFQDREVYKTTFDQVDYRLEVVFSNGVRQQLAERNANYTPTAIRRSWGSIKAMFQF